MIKIAIVEDDMQEAKMLTEGLTRFQREKHLYFTIHHFKDADSFLKDCHTGFDLVFMDIELPNINGMEAARWFRKSDRQAVLIFVTNISQFALKGYEVEALDYVLKPVRFQKLALVLERALSIIRSNQELELVISHSSGLVRISTKELLYVEVRGHLLSYHTVDRILKGSGSLSELEQRLHNRRFLRCNNCYLVNPRFIESIKGCIIALYNGEQLKISQPKRKQFMMEINAWLGAGNY